MLQNILVAYDGSKPAERAFLAAVELARSGGGRVRVVAVIALPTAHLDIGAPFSLDTECDSLTSALASLAQSIPAGTCPIETDIAYGNPADVLIEQARAHGMDHIVLGRTGKGAMQRLLIGSVSREIVDRAGVAVTLVP